MVTTVLAVCTRSPVSAVVEHVTRTETTKTGTHNLFTAAGQVRVLSATITEMTTPAETTELRLWGNLRRFIRDGEAANLSSSVWKGQIVQNSEESAATTCQVFGGSFPER